MAIKRLEILLCDMHEDGETPEAQETLSFGLGSEVYEMELCEKHADALRASLAEYMTHGRRLVSRRRLGPVGPPRDRERSARIRQWAKDQGKEVSDRGRIPLELEYEYERHMTAPPAKEDDSKDEKKEEKSGKTGKKGNAA